MQLTDKDGNVFGIGGLEITTSDGKPKIPVINTDITIGVTSIVGGVAGRLLYDNAGVVGETGGINWNPVSSTLSLLDSPFYSQAGNSSANTDFSITGTANSNYTIYSSRQFIFNTGQSMYFNTDTDGGSALDRAWYFAGARSGITGGRTYGALTVDSSGFPSFTLYNNDNGARILLASNTASYFNGGNLLVGTTTDAGFKLDVNGSTRVTSLRTADIFPASANISLWVNSLNASSRFYTAPVHQDGRINFNAIAGGSDQVLIRAWHTGSFGLGTGSSAAGGALTVRGDSLLIGTAGSLFFMNGTFGPNNVPYRLGISTNATTAAFYSGVGNNLTNIESTKFEFTATSHTFYTGTTTGNQSNPNQFIPLNLSNLGNVTIGSTTDAGFRLDVAGTARVQVSSAGIPNILSISNLQTDAGPGGAIAFYTGGVVGNASRIVAQRSGSVGQSDIALETNGVRRLFVSANNGNVGIGTTILGTTTQLTIGAAQTASSAIARSVLLNTSLTAAANNDVLIGLDVQPTFTNGAFTGVANYNLRTGGLITKQYFQSPTTNQGNHSISFGFGGAGEQVRLIASAAGAVGRGNLYIASASGDTAVATISDANALFAFAGNSFYKSFNIDQVSLTTGQGLYISGNQPASVINGIFFRYSETRVAILSKPHGSNGYADFRIAIVPVGGANNPPQESDTKFMITKDTTNVLVNTTIDSGFKLDVNGSARVQSGLTVSGSLNLNSSDISSAWTAYTPTWSTDGATQPSLGNGTITGSYKVIGKTVFVRVRLVFGTTTTGGTGTFYFSLPVNAAIAWGVQMPASILDNGFAWYQATVNGEYGGLTDRVALIGQSPGGANSSQSVTAVFPVGFGNLDSIQFNGSYESA